MTTEKPTANNAPRTYTQSADRWWKRSVAWLLLALPILIFGLLWYRYAINIPKWDDHALRAFLYYFDQEPTLTGKFYQLFRQHNEHRIVYDRIVTAIDYRLAGTLNYVHLMLVGNLSLVGLLAVFMSALRYSRQDLSAIQCVFYSIPVAWLLFNLSQWENMYWGMAALQNFSVVLWVIAAFYFLSYTRHWKLAFVAGVLATLTSGNGMMVWPLGAMILVIRWPAYFSRNHKHAYYPLLGWVIGAVVVVGLYFTGFEKPEGVKYVKPGVIDLTKGWLAVMGASAEAIPGNFPLRNSMLLGGLMVLLTLGISGWGLFTNRLLLLKLFRRLTAPKANSLAADQVVPSLTLFFWSCAAFILGTAAVVAWARTGAGIDLLITSRYKMYSLTGLALLYIVVTANLPRQIVGWWAAGSLIASVMFAGLSYFAFLDEVIWWRHWNTTNQFNSTHSTNSPTALSDPVTQHYTPPTSVFYDQALSVLYGPANQAAIILELKKTDGSYSLQNTTLPPRGLGDAGAYVLARSSKRTYMFPVRQNQQSMLAAGFNPNNLLINGFNSSILPNQMEAGMYQLFVVTVSENGDCVLHPTNQRITSTGPSGAEEAKNW
ncbi:hypothetical protein [Spirosoma aerophilum]